METLPLSALTTFIRRVFALNLPEPVWVAAELAQVSEARGHTWLTLVEKSETDDSIHAQMDAVLWAGVRKKLAKTHRPAVLRGLLQDGMSVRLRVTASFHERYGLKLVVEDIDPAHTIGVLEQRRQATLGALQADLLLDRNAALPLPLLMRRLAVISAETAAGLADFREHLQGNAYGYVFTLDLYPAAMQGMQTGSEIMQRIRQIGRRRTEYDAIVIVRGGGAKTDLAAFDEETLCRAIADAPLPVLAGIGHEVDDTVTDRVVHRSLKTPTAVAAFLIEHTVRAEQRVLQLGRMVELQATQSWHRQGERVSALANGIRQSARASVQAGLLRTDALEDRLFALADRNLQLARQQLSHRERLLQALRPETTLARGFALVSQAGRLITDPDDLAEGEVEVRLRDGRTKLHKK